MCPFLLTSLLCPHISPLAGCLLAGCWCLLCRTGCGEISQQLFVDRRRRRGPSYVHTRWSYPGNRPCRRLFHPPGLPAPGLATGPLFDFFGLAEFVCVYYTRSKWDDGLEQGEVQYTTGTGPYLTCRPL